MNVERAVCGLAAPFDVDSRDGRRFAGEHFRSWLESCAGLDMLLDHGPAYRPVRAIQRPDGEVVYSSGVELPTVGRWHRFAALDGTSSVPAGLLVLGDVHDGLVGDEVLSAVRSGSLYGLSIGAEAWRRNDGELDFYWPTEVSLTPRPAFDQALVLATGTAAVRAFELLTGQSVAVSA